MSEKGSSPGIILSMQEGAFGYTVEFVDERLYFDLEVEVQTLPLPHAEGSVEETGISLSTLKGNFEEGA